MLPTDEVRVAFPFLLTLEHRKLRPREMFKVSRVFDLHEMGGSGLVVDVEDVAPTQTILRVTPTKPMTYDAIEAEADRIVEQAGTQAFGEAPTLARLDWLVPDPGMHTRDRQTTGRIR